ncbi:hypothetical protein C2E23DRAFT_732763, partial [Lenzites betulinus]
WSDGCEEYYVMEREAIARALGLATTRIPFLSQLQDPIGELDPWSEEGLEALRRETAEPLTPMWHQMVGILKIMDNLFEGKNVLIMDEVGVGKTLQAVGAIAIFEYQRLHFQRTGKHSDRFSQSGRFRFHARTTSKGVRPKPSHACPLGLVDNTLFSPKQRYAIFICDEAHYGRTFNKLRIACVELTARSRMTVALTATPVMTGPMVFTCSFMRAPPN